MEKPNSCPVEVAVQATKAVREAAVNFEKKIAALSAGTRGQASNVFKNQSH